MKRIRDQISKEVLLISEAEIAGIVTNAYVSGKLDRVKGWRVSNEESDKAPMAERRRVIGYGDVLTLTNANALRDGEFFPCPLGAQLFDSLGRSLGVLRDLEFDETTGITHSLLSDNSAYSPDLVIAAGKRAVIFRAEEHAKKTFRRGGITKRTERSKALARSIENAEKLDYFNEQNAFHKGQALEEKTNNAETQTSASENTQNSYEDPTNMSVSENVYAEIDFSAKTPAQATNSFEEEHFILNEEENSDLSDQTDVLDLGEYRFLLGRTLLKNVLSGKEIIAERGDEVSAEIIKKARLSGKLVELTVNSKKQ